MRRLFNGLAIGITLISVGGAGPTTKPAETKKPIPSNWYKIENKTNHFTFRVPAQWKKRQISDPQTQFDMPASVQMEGTGFFGVFATNCHRATFDENVEQQRKAFLADAKGGKLTADQETTLGTRRLWLITIEVPTVSKEIRVVNNKPPVTIEHKTTDYRTIVFTIDGATSYTVDFMGGQNVYKKNIAQLKMITDSFEWADQPAAKS